MKPSTNTPMWTHFDAALDAHNAVLRGALFEARAAGEKLVLGRERDMPRGSDSLMQELREIGRKLGSAADLTDAALHTAHVAELCGDCHRMFGPGPIFGGGGVPPDRTRDVSREMQRHGWAAARLWEGITGPSDAAWMAGARVLRDAPMAPSSLPAREGVREEVTALERRVHQLGQLSLGATKSDRTVIYSNLIATCASCHASVGGS